MIDDVNAQNVIEIYDYEGTDAKIYGKYGEHASTGIVKRFTSYEDRL